MTFLTTSCLYYHHTLLYYHHYINHHRHQLEKGAELSNLSQPPRTYTSPDEIATGVHPIVQTTYLCALSRQRSSAPSEQEVFIHFGTIAMLIPLRVRRNLSYTLQH